MNNRPASTIQQLSNPFTYGKPVSDTKRFVGRKEEVQQIFSLLRASDFGSGSIVGERRSGKTSFLNYISHPDTVRQHGLDPDACLLVYLDLDMLVPTSTPSRFYEYMLRRIAARVQDQKLREQMREVGQQEKIVNYDLDELFDSVDAQGLRIALLLDEFQNVANNGNFGLDFLYGLRSLATHHGLALITSNRVSLEETGPSETMHSSPWFNIFSTTILLPFSRSDVEDMLQKYLQGTGVSFTDTEVRYVLSLAGMMPFPLQAAFGFLFEAHQVERDEDHMLAFVKERFEQVASPYFESCWHNSSEREKAALALLTLLASQHNGQPSYWKSAQLESWYMNAGGALNRLADRGLLIRSHDRYALASTSLYRWIAEELTSPAREADREEERRYESQIKASLPQQDVARIVQWLRGVDTKYRSLFARWACDPRTSEKAFDLFTSSKLPFEASGMRRGDVESGST